MIIKRITLTNYRRFDKFVMNFNSDLTVIVARNGKGKTTVLEAVAAALGPFVGAFDLGKSEHILRTDARYSRLGSDFDNEQNFPVIIAAEALNPEVQWQRALNSPKGRTTIKEAAPLANLGNKLQTELRSNPNIKLPIICYYPSSRLWINHKDSSRKSVISTSRTLGYEDCLSAASSFKQMQKWIKDVTASIQQEKEFKGYENSTLKQRLAGVQNAVNQVLAIEGWQHFHYSFAHAELVMWHADHGLLPISMLSDGVRAVISLTADLAFRCARLNGFLGEQAPLETAGIVLIDEVDLHLHPAWQQNILASLQSAFPQVQFIVTTHSPQVISTVEHNKIRIIEQCETGTYQAVQPNSEVKGTESSVALLEVMGVNPIATNLQEAQWLHAYIQKIETGEYKDAAAQELRRKLSNFYGEQHPILLDADRLIRFQSFKLKQQAKE